MKFLRTILVLSFAFALAPLITLAAPGIPNQFYGTVSYSNGSVPDGTVVEAKTDGGEAVGKSVTSNSKYGYSPNLFFVIDLNDGSPKDLLPEQTIKFFLNGADTGAIAQFSNGGYTQLNLGLTVSLPPAPSGGGGGTPPATSPLSAEAQKVDSNKDGKIDVLDFNSLMVNWGKTETGNVADFNGDGKVDIFDFNLLMINWTV